MTEDTREDSSEAQGDAETPPWKVGDIAHWQYRRIPDGEWFTLRLLDDSPDTEHDWHGRVVDPGTYDGFTKGQDCWVFESCLGPVPA
jgi:hypothetical protein